MKKMVMIGVGVIVLLAAAIGGTLFVTGAFGGHAAAESTEVAPAPVKAAAADGSSLYRQYRGRFRHSLFTS